MLQREKSLISSEDPAQPKINILKKACQGFKNKRLKLAKKKKKKEKIFKRHICQNNNDKSLMRNKAVLQKV